MVIWCFGQFEEVCLYMPWKICHRLLALWSENNDQLWSEKNDQLAEISTKVHATRVVTFFFFFFFGEHRWMWPYLDFKASATQTFITCHCPQACSNVFMLISQNKATFSGVLQKKKKKGSSPVWREVSWHLRLPPFFFWRSNLSWTFFSLQSVNAWPYSSHVKIL